MAMSNTPAQRDYYHTYWRKNKGKLQAKQRERYRLVRQRLDKIKEDSACADCGNNYPACVMDFDHVEGVKVAAISTMVNYTWPRIEAEIGKCEVVCANCHRLRHYIQS